MTTTWTHAAILSLKVHFEFFKQTKGIPFARTWRKKVFDKVETLKSFPRLGRQETSKLHPSQEFRSLLEGNYRIVYQINAQEIIIHYVFNTRQNPNGLIF